MNFYIERLYLIKHDVSIEYQILNLHNKEFIKLGLNNQRKNNNYIFFNIEISDQY